MRHAWYDPDVMELTAVRKVTIKRVTCHARFQGKGGTPLIFYLGVYSLGNPYLTNFCQCSENSYINTRIRHQAG